MDIEFRRIDKSNYSECIELKVSEDQKDFVAPNMFSLVQAAYEPEIYPLAIYSGDKMVGFLLYDFDYELKGWSMSRFMIDAKYQNQGLGKLALQKFLELFISKHGHLKLYTSAETNNQVALALYEKLGFEKQETFEYTTGGKTYREIRMVVQL